jgi:hypothetical protein
MGELAEDRMKETRQRGLLEEERAYRKGEADTAFGRQKELVDKATTSRRTENISGRLAQQEAAETAFEREEGLLEREMAGKRVDKISDRLAGEEKEARAAKGELASDYAYLDEEKGEEISRATYAALPAKEKERFKSKAAIDAEIARGTLKARTLKVGGSGKEAKYFNVSPKIEEQENERAYEEAEANYDKRFPDGGAIDSEGKEVSEDSWIGKEAAKIYNRNMNIRLKQDSGASTGARRPSGNPQNDAIFARLGIGGGQAPKAGGADRVVEDRKILSMKPETWSKEDANAKLMKAMDDRGLNEKVVTSTISRSRDKTSFHR